MPKSRENRHRTARLRSRHDKRIHERDEVKAINDIFREAFVEAFFEELLTTDLVNPLELLAAAKVIAQQFFAKPAPKISA